MKDDLRYTPSTVLRRFRFPRTSRQTPTLESAGNAYYEFRAALMLRNNEGLTKTYNRFHDPNETSPDILKLRELHAAMDRAVLDAYGWTDLKPTCEFLLDYEEDEDEEDDGGGAGQEALALPLARRVPRRSPRQLLDLNRERAEEERLAGAAAEAKEEKVERAGKPKRSGREEGQGQMTQRQVEMNELHEDVAAMRRRGTTDAVRAGRRQSPEKRAKSSKK